MRAAIDVSGAREVLLALDGRLCLACGTPQVYEYRTAGRTIWRLDELVVLDVQIGHCPNGKCELRRKSTHPPEEWQYAPPYSNFGSDVLVKCGTLRFQERLTRKQIHDRVKQEHKVQICERSVGTLYDLYGALVSGANLDDPALIRQLRQQRVIVISLDGAEPIKGHETVWFVRDAISGRMLASKSMRSCTSADLVKLLMPVKEFAERNGIRVVGVVSDAEKKNLDAVAKVFPGIPHQLCQFHYIKNIAKPLTKEDGDLRKEMREQFRGLRDIERDIQAAADSGGELDEKQSKVLLAVCQALQSVLKDSGKPPFEPPGLKLYEKLIEVQTAVAEMHRKKGGTAHTS